MGWWACEAKGKAQLGKHWGRTYRLESPKGEQMMIGSGKMRGSNQSEAAYLMQGGVVTGVAIAVAGALTSC